METVAGWTVETVRHVHALESERLGDGTDVLDKN